jgi:hypothetical protein
MACAPKFVLLHLLVLRKCDLMTFSGDVDCDSARLEQHPLSTCSIMTQSFLASLLSEKTFPSKHTFTMAILELVNTLNN